MPKAYHMPQFVNNNSKFITVLPNRDRLRSISPPAHIGAASGIKQKEGMVAEREVLGELQRIETFGKNCNESESPIDTEAEQLFMNKDG